MTQIPTPRRRWLKWAFLGSLAILLVLAFVDLTPAEPSLYVLEQNFLPERGEHAVATDAARRRILTAGYSGLLIFDMDTGEPVAALSKSGHDNVSLNQAHGVAFDELHDRIFIADTGNHRVQVLDSGTLAYLATIAGASGQGGISGHPVGVAVGSGQGHIIITGLDGRITVIDWLTFAPVATIDPFSWPVPGDEIDKVRAPRGVAVDTVNRHILVVDYATHSAHVLDSATFTHVATIGGRGSEPHQLREPWFVTVNPDLGHILVSDLGNRCIKVFDAKTFAYIGKIKEDFFVSDGMSFSGGKLYISAVRPKATGNSLMVFKPVVAEPMSK